MTGAEAGPTPVPPPSGFAVGHWTDSAARTGCTVILPPPGAACGVDVRGGGPGSRETEVIGPLTNAQEATAVLLTGGSAFGLAAADGVTRWCEEQGRGYETPGGLVPLVPAAVIYDLLAGDAAVRPGPEAGRAACEAAVADAIPERGAVGAGTGAAVAKALGREHAVAGGVGYAALRLGSGRTVAAVAVANATGDVLAADGTALAAPRSPGGEELRSVELMQQAEGPPEWTRAEPREATTLVCVMTDADLDKVAANKVARMASAGIARAVDPVFTPFDGDIVFCLASGQRANESWGVLTAGAAAATVTAEAIRDAVRTASGR